MKLKLQLFTAGIGTFMGSETGMARKLDQLGIYCTFTQYIEQVKSHHL